MAQFITSSSPANTHAFFSGVVILDVVPGNKTAIRMACEALSQGPLYEALANVFKGEYGIPMTIDYYNSGRAEFLPGTIAFVQGAVSIDSAQATGDASPKALIRADQLIPMQGDPESSEFGKHMPFMAHGSLSFIGTLVNTRVESGHRLFVFTTTVYNNERNRNQNAPKFSTFKVACALPDGPRWNNFPTPAHGGHMQASGNWVGFYDINGERCLCVVATNLSFILSPTRLIPLHFPDDGDCCCPTCMTWWEEENSE
ncbi:uncharacterized protein N7503_005104 [Penicillium pulvis]|uniref:uncharacterized protein n=1 Tax=Penicillium pulvis TaxID=1562058 RepID=UPI0025478628|nr:uncharacterized protein N7503_005104 [Penicillium pulvis]KAJ5802654.1 hypothetical protein N7503_005104 [Penicillium pulvis]